MLRPAAVLTLFFLSTSLGFGQERPFDPQDFLPPSELEYFDDGAEELLADLALAENEEDARDLERRLMTLWSRSGSATADLLLSRSQEALEEDNFETMALLLDELTELAPNFAEGWHQHAISAMRQENFEEAMASLRQTLALEPKHFIAMAELGSILEEFGDDERALAAYREALAVNPFIEGLEERIRELARSVEGQGI
jgi:tetratricopeptide (TPR) repeat protein